MFDFTFNKMKLRGILVGLSALFVATTGFCQSCPVTPKVLTSEEVRQRIQEHQLWLRDQRTWLPPPDPHLPEPYQTPPRIPPNAINDPRRADFSCTTLSKENFPPGITFDLGGRWGLDLSYASFNKSKLEGIYFLQVSLRGALFLDAELEDVQFLNSDIRSANFYGAGLKNINFFGARLASVLYEPKSATGLTFLYMTDGLERMTFQWNAAPLVALREVLRRDGQRDLERKVAFAIEHRRTVRDWEELGDKPSGALRYIAWELPTRYDLQPTRALYIIALLVVLFAFPYWYALRQRGPRKIWVIRPKDRLDSDGRELIEPARDRGLRRVLRALQFSLYSAFQLGWRDLNVGTWLAKLQSKEYALRGSGWIRTVSGIQSLLSVYLLAMWALTEFGRLFSD